MTVLGMIPARAGSRRLPDKALRPLAGRPMIAYTCLAARDSGVLGAVCVNTDSAEIAAVARDFGVECPVLRPADLAADDTPTRDAVHFMLTHLQQRGQRYDAVMLLQPTSPLRTAEDIRAAWQLYCEHAPCEVVSVSEVAPRGWLGTVRPDGDFERWDGGQKVWKLNGAIYIHDTAAYQARRTAPRTLAYRMPSIRGVDIDTADDLAVAEAILRHAVRGPTAAPGVART